jgi:hypothetical protein
MLPGESPRGNRRLTESELDKLASGDLDFKLVELAVIEIRERRGAASENSPVMQQIRNVIGGA